MNSSLHPDVLAIDPSLSIPENVPLTDCDLFNLTFTNIADERLFEHYKGSVRCRCPLSRSGTSCETDLHENSLKLSRNDKSDQHSSGTITLIFLSFAFTLLTIRVFLSVSKKLQMIFFIRA
ncbi:unnamed protein product [Anisakis simplex]|uniref:Uncharacterized protein n=1 Tax=Anisakis simplex TaxID=6269 RepID=A0A3P6N8E1_ANISI|nr:unnamed protein product [Anisakis simplex]